MAQWPPLAAPLCLIIFIIYPNLFQSYFASASAHSTGSVQSAASTTINAMANELMDRVITKIEEKRLSKYLHSTR